MKNHSGERHPNGQVADLIGIDRRSVRAYLKRAGIKIEGNQSEEREISSGDADEQEIKNLRHEVKGRPMYLVARDSDGNEAREAYTSYNASVFVKKQKAAGRSVAISFQVANLHIFNPDAQPRARRVREMPDMEAMREARGSTNEKPKVKALPPIGYDPVWIRGQLALRLDLQGWKQGDRRYVRPDTGELLSTDAPAKALLEFLLGHALSSPKPSSPPKEKVEPEIPEDDPLLKMAVEELGAKVRRRNKGEVAWSD